MSSFDVVVERIKYSIFFCAVIYSTNSTKFRIASMSFVDMAK